MINDYRGSDDMNKGWKEWKRNNGHEKEGEFDLMVQVVTYGMWPTYKTHDIAIPKEISCQLH